MKLTKTLFLILSFFLFVNADLFAFKLKEDTLVRILDTLVLKDRPVVRWNHFDIPLRIKSTHEDGDKIVLSSFKLQDEYGNIPLEGKKVKKIYVKIDPLNYLDVTKNKSRRNPKVRINSKGEISVRFYRRELCKSRIGFARYKYELQTSFYYYNIGILYRNEEIFFGGVLEVN